MSCRLRQIPRNEEFSKLAVHLIEEKREKLLFWPAAVSFHHAERSGLAPHHHDAASRVEALLPIYPSPQPQPAAVRRDRARSLQDGRAGAAEFGIATEYTKEGQSAGAHRRGCGAHRGGLQVNWGCRRRQLLVEHMVLPPRNAGIRPPAAALPRGADAAPAGHDGRADVLRASRRCAPRGVLRPRARALKAASSIIPIWTKNKPMAAPFSAASTRARGSARWHLSDIHGQRMLNGALAAAGLPPADRLIVCATPKKD